MNRFFEGHRYPVPFGDSGSLSRVAVAVAVHLLRPGLRDATGKNILRGFQNVVVTR